MTFGIGIGIGNRNEGRNEEDEMQSSSEEILAEHCFVVVPITGFISLWWMADLPSM